MSAFDQAAKDEKQAETATLAARATTDTTSVQAKQLSEAVQKGLLVDVSPERNVTDETNNGISPATTLVSQPSPAKEPVDELDEWDKARGEDDEFFLDEEDSDDDLI